MRLGLIVDNLRVAEWQAEALCRIAGDTEFVVFNCTNSRRRAQPLKHILYYVLRLRSLNMPLTRSRPIPRQLKVIKCINFEAENDRSWQSLPRHVIQHIQELSPAAILKFGMGLLRVPPELPYPILSYHHGDPRKYRGRPAGFYEMLAGEPILGQVVQILSNMLDSGKVAGFAETRIRPHSYRATMEDAYRCSALLLPRALCNALSGTTLPIEPSGGNYRLPSNTAVLRFVGRMAAASVRRLAYGAFFEKLWQVANAPGGDLDPAHLLDDFPHPSSWREMTCPGEYRFIADPFPHPLLDGILVEGLRRSDGQGEICCLKSASPEPLCAGKGHFSYPATICLGNDCFLVPEVSEWSLPRIFRLSGESAREIGLLRLEGSPRLIDPSLFQTSDSTVYLFANDDSAGDGVLWLWFADSLFGQFAEHPHSPIRISPAGARMGGALMHANGQGL